MKFMQWEVHFLLDPFFYFHEMDVMDIDKDEAYQVTFEN
jgi:hypothetical protein